MSVLTSPFFDLEEDLIALEARGRRRKLRTFVPKGPTRALLDGHEVTLFAGNDYLGLSWDTRVIRAFRDAAETHGVGSGASRLITGTSDLHAELEKRIAQFKKTEDAIVFSSGFLANMGTITALANKDDFIVMDKLNHASLIDAARASGAAKVRIYPHKNHKRLEELLKLGAGYRRRMIITDSVFSMDGDFADLKELVRLKNIYSAWLMIDEAHGTGILGKRGAGLAEEEGVEDEVDIKMGTLSKAVGTMGGFVAGPKTLIDYLRNHARSFIYSTALPPAVMAASLAALEIIEREPPLREKLWNNVNILRSGLKRIGLSIGPTASPIIPIILGSDESTMKLSEALLEDGFYVPGIRPPSVPPGEARLRVTVSAAHTESDLRGLISALEHREKLWKDAVS